MKAHQAIPIALTVVLLPSCGALKPKEDPTQHFVLRPTAAPGGSTTSHSNLTISVGPTLVPAYLDRVQMVSAGASSNQLKVDEYEIWAEPLDRAISRVLADNLSRRMKAPRVVPYPDLDLTKYDYRVAIWVKRFERDTSGEIVLDCAWGIGGMPGSDLPMVNKTSRITVPGPADPADSSGLAAAMSEALAKLSEDVRRQLLKMPLPKSEEDGEEEDGGT